MRRRESGSVRTRPALTDSLGRRTDERSTQLTTPSHTSAAQISSRDRRGAGAHRRSGDGRKGPGQCGVLGPQGHDHGHGRDRFDWLVRTIDPVIAVAGSARAVALLVAQLAARRYHRWPYWAAVAMVSVFGTMAADVTHIVFASCIWRPPRFGAVNARVCPRVAPGRRHVGDPHYHHAACASCSDWATVRRPRPRHGGGRLTATTSNWATPPGRAVRPSRSPYLRPHNCFAHGRRPRLWTPMSDPPARRPFAD
jgi:hypothetical protein